MDKLAAIENVETRAFNARKTISEVCGIAKVLPTNWSRVKREKSIGPKLLARMEAALDEIERERADAQNR